MNGIDKTVDPKNEWIQTFTGHAFPIFGSCAFDIRLEDVAHALSNLCRFGGHVRRFYSVAQHSVLVATILAEDRGWTWSSPIVRFGLLHDAAEAYLVDVPRPIKRSLTEYGPIEKCIMRSVIERFNVRGVGGLYDAEVKLADNIALMTEHRDLLCSCERPWGDEFAQYVPRRQVVVPYYPEVAEKLFLAVAESVGVR